jgi:hypothetical protein
MDPEAEKMPKKPQYISKERVDMLIKTHIEEVIKRWRLNT